VKVLLKDVLDRSVRVNSWYSRKRTDAELLAEWQSGVLTQEPARGTVPALGRLKSVTKFKPPGFWKAGGAGYAAVTSGLPALEAATSLASVVDEPPVVLAARIVWYRNRHKIAQVDDAATCRGYIGKYRALK
jgi:hypothetical protein